MSGRGEPQLSDVNIRQSLVDRGATGVSVGPVTAESFTVTNIVEARPFLATNTVEYARRLLVKHQDRLAALRGFSEFLHEARLPFVEPPRSDFAHPQRVWRELQRARPGGGVLLSGAGGVGKTRCAVEVATLAEASRWQVVWLRDAEHTPPLLVLESALDSAVGGLCDYDVLLVLDYVDQMVGLNLEHLSRHFSSFDNRVRLLATSRPLRSEQLSRGLPLTSVTVDPPPEQRRALISTMIRQAAPKALARLGDAVLAQICGDRPIIALLIARVLEEREESEALTEEFLAHARTRGRELFLWLDRRLSAFVRDLGESFGDAAEKKTKLDRLVAAILALSPLSQADLQAGARLVAERLGMQPDDADDLIGLLYETGWLEGDPERELWVVHDVVADQALEVALAADRPSERQKALGDALAGISTGARALGRVTTSLSRAAVSGEERFRQRLEADARVWWNTHIETLAAVIAEDHHDIAGYALGSLLKRAPWQAFILERWNDLLGPWLERYGTAAGARHVLYLGLRNVRRGALKMISAARVWLGVNGLDVSASFVLASLIEHPETNDEVFEEAVGRALAWLREHGANDEARYVLAALLRQPRLSQPALLEASDHAEVWLKQYGTREYATYVLAAQLEQPRSRQDAARDAVERALEWLREHGSHEHGGYLLPALLRQTRLDEPAALEARQQALAWLKQYLSRESATYVLTALLEHPALEKEAAQYAGARALEWLREHETHEQAGFVLPALLRQPQLDEATAREATAQTLLWLQKHWRRQDATFVLLALLEQPRLNEAVARDASQRALEWLGEHPVEEEARFVLRALLLRPQRDQVAQEACTRALRWLEAHGLRREAELVLSSLLAQPTLSEQHESKAVVCAMAWLTEHGTQMHAGFMLRGLLERPSLANETLLTVCERALAWSKSHVDHEDASFVIRALLRQRLHEPAASAASERALEWLEIHGEREDASFVLKALLERGWLSDATAKAVERALAWLSRHGTLESAQFVLRALLGVDRSPASLDHAAAWIERYGVSDSLLFVAVPLLKCDELDDARWRDCAALVCQRLNSDPQQYITSAALNALRRREHLIDGSVKTGLSVVGSDKSLSERSMVWNQLEQLRGQNVRGRIVSQLEGGFSVELERGLEGFLPASRIGTRPVGELDTIVGRELEFKVLRVDRLRGSLVLCRRQLAGAERQSRIEALLDGLREGEATEGVVIAIKDFGVFIDLGELVGMIHSSELSWDPSASPSASLHIGDRMQVKVLKIDREKRRVALSRKRLIPDPWSTIKQRYSPGQIVEGKFLRSDPRGTIVELEPGLEGALPEDEMSWPGQQLDGLFDIGDRARAMVLAVDPDRRRLTLSVKRLPERRRERILKQYPPGTRIEGAVSQVADFGVFVELEPGIEGLVRLRDLGGASGQQRQRFREGERVRAVVLRIDDPGTTPRIGLGMLARVQQGRQPPRR